ncbi:hypothetical protein MMC25_003868 [Agyrium rufum]|nr:hypothetical protein [Agyrium rufum]
MKDVLATVELLGEAQKKRSSMKLLQKIEPFDGGILRFERAIDQFANSAPKLMALIWASTKMLLMLASHVIESFERLSEILALVGNRLSLVERYAQIFEDALQTQEKLSKVYSDLIELCVSAIRFYRRKGIHIIWRSLWTSFELELKGIVSRIMEAFGNAKDEANLQHVERVQSAILEQGRFQCEMRDAGSQHAASLDRNQQVLERIDGRLDTLLSLQISYDEAGLRQKRDVLSWLNPPDYEIRLQWIRQGWASGTGGWFLDRIRCLGYLDDTPGATIWVHGAPGCGKTVLASFAVDETQKVGERQDVLALYYFCTFKDQLRSSMISVLSAFVAQVLLKEPGLVSHAFSSMASSGEDHVTSTTKLLSLLSDLLCTFQTVWITIDALDECADGISLLTSMVQLLQRPDLSFNLLICSRNEVAIRAKLGIYTTIHVALEATANDIATFTTFALGDLYEVLDADVFTDVKQKLLSGANGSFLWIKLIIESLDGVFLHEEIDHLLDNVPSELEQVYNRMFERAFRLNPTKIDLAIRILEFLNVSRRPSTIEELDDLLATRACQSDFSRKARAFDLRYLINKLFGSIIYVRPAPCNTLELTHLTVKDYLRKNNECPIKIAQAENNMATVCLTFLNFKRFWASDSQPVHMEHLRKSERLLDYAITYWGPHLTTIRLPSPTLVAALVSFLNSSKAVSHWFRLLALSETQPTGGRIMNDLLLLASHLRKLATTMNLQVPPSILKGAWLTELLHAVLEKLVKSKGEDDLQTLEWYAVLGRFTNISSLSEGYLQKAIAGKSKILGSEHADTMSTMLILGRVYWNMSRLDEAEATFRRCLDVRKEANGEQHPETLEAMSWVASVCRGKGRLDQAYKMLGVAKRAQGDHEVTEKLFAESWAFFEDVHGPMHPDTVQCIKNLAMVYQLSDRLVEAETLHREVIAKQEEVLGDDEELYISLHNLGETLLALRRYEEAEAILLRAWRGKEVWHGVHHPQTLLTNRLLRDLYEQKPSTDAKRTAAEVDVCQA